MHLINESELAGAEDVGHQWPAHNYLTAPSSRLQKGISDIVQQPTRKHFASFHSISKKSLGLYLRPVTRNLSRHIPPLLQKSSQLIRVSKSITVRSHRYVLYGFFSHLL